MATNLVPKKSKWQQEATKGYDYPQQLSHNSRNISRIVISIFFIAAVVLLLSYTPNSNRKYPDFQKEKKLLLQNADSPDSHVTMGAYFENNNNFIDAKKEYLLAQQYGARGIEPRLAQLDEKMNAPAVVAAAAVQWQNFVIRHPTYRDGWLALAALDYQLKKLDQANIAINHVLNLDPQNTTVLILLRMIK